MNVDLQAVQLRRFSIYFDVDQQHWEQEKAWHDLTLDDWDSFFRPGISEDDEDLHRTYVLKPVDGRTMYVRRGRAVRKKEDEAVQEADVALQPLTLHLSRKRLLQRVLSFV